MSAVPGRHDDMLDPVHRTPARILVGLGLTVLLAALIWMLASRGDALPLGEPTIPPAASPLVPAPTATNDPPPAEAQPADPGHARELVTSESQTTKPTRTGVRGRAVTAEDGSPLADIEISITVQRDGVEALRVRVRTDEQGVFAHSIDCDVPSTWHAYTPPLRNRAAAWAPRQTLQPGEQVDLGELRLGLGRAVAGIVVDAEGAPIPNAILTFIHADAHGRGVRAGADGRFEAFVYHCGKWTIQNNTDGYPHATVAKVELQPADDTLFLRIVLGGQAEIHGRTVDEAGRAVAGVQIAFRAGDERGATKSDEQGHFVARARTDAAPASFELGIDDECNEPVSFPKNVEWGTREVRVVVRRRAPASLEVRALLGAERDALPAFKVRLRNLARPTGRVEHQAQASRGTARFAELAPARYELHVIPARRDVQTTYHGPFELAPGQRASIDVAVDVLPLAVVRVRTRGGAALSGATVECIQPGSEPATVDMRVGPPQTFWIHSNDPTHRPTFLIGSAVTNDAGEAEVACPRQRQEIALRVRAIAHETRMLTAAELAGMPQPWTVELLPTAALRGSVKPLHPTWSVRVQLDRDSPADADGQAQVIVPVAEDGTYHVESLTPGLWRVSLLVSSRSRGGSGLPLVPEPATARVEPGAGNRLEIDATRCAAGTIEGRARLGGALAEGFEVQAVCVDERNGGASYNYFGPATVAPDGTFSLPGVPAGTVDLMLWRRGSSEQRRSVFLDTPVQVAAGQVMSHSFEFPRRQLRVRVLAPDGKTPASRVRVYVSRDRSIWTDDKGMAVFDLVPRRIVDVMVEGAEPLRGVEFPFGGGDVTREVVLKP